MDFRAPRKNYTFFLFFLLATRVSSSKLLQVARHIDLSKDTYSEKKSQHHFRGPDISAFSSIYLYFSPIDHKDIQPLGTIRRETGSLSFH